MKERIKKYLSKYITMENYERFYILFIGGIAVYFGIAALGQDSPAGMVGIFFMLLYWAQAMREVRMCQKSYKEMSKLCDECLEGWSRCADAKLDRVLRARPINPKEVN